MIIPLGKDSHIDNNTHGVHCDHTHTKISSHVAVRNPQVTNFLIPRIDKNTMWKWSSKYAQDGEMKEGVIIPGKDGHMCLGRRDLHLGIIDRRMYEEHLKRSWS
jgi:hypothetical protein